MLMQDILLHMQSFQVLMQDILLHMQSFLMHVQNILMHMQSFIMHVQNILMHVQSFIMHVHNIFSLQPFSNSLHQNIFTPAEVAVIETSLLPHHNQFRPRYIQFRRTKFVEFTNMYSH